MADTTSLQLSKLLNKTLNYEKTISSSRLIKLFTATDDIHDIDVTLTINSDEFISFNAINGNFFIKNNNQNSILPSAKIGYTIDSKGYFLYLYSNPNSFVAKISLKINNGAVNIESILTAQGNPTGVSFTKDIQLTSDKKNIPIVDELIVSKLRNEQNDPNYILLSNGSTIEKSDLLGEVQDNDTYPISFGFTEKETEGSLSFKLNNDKTFEAKIPFASSTDAGLVSTEDQTFIGEKTFENIIYPLGGIYSTKTHGVEVKASLSGSDNEYLGLNYSSSNSSDIVIDLFESYFDNYSIPSINLFSNIKFYTGPDGNITTETTEQNARKMTFTFECKKNTDTAGQYDYYIPLYIATKKFNESEDGLNFLMRNIKSINVGDPVNPQKNAIFGYCSKSVSGSSTTYAFSNGINNFKLLKELQFGSGHVDDVSSTSNNGKSYQLSTVDLSEDCYYYVLGFHANTSVGEKFTVTIEFEDNGKYGDTARSLHQQYWIDTRPSVLMKFNSYPNNPQLDNIILNKNTYLQDTTTAVTSDERDKCRFKQLDERALEFIKTIPTYTYFSNNRDNYLINSGKGKEYDIEEHKKESKRSNRRKVGVKAQEVYRIMQNIYHTKNYANVVDYNKYSLNSDELDRYYVHYESFIPFLIKSIQIQQKQIESLNQTILQLQEEINSLKNNTSEVVENQEIITEE